MTREAQFRELFQATYPVLSRYGRHRGIGGDDLQDLLADTYEVAWRRFDDVPSGEEALPWLIGVARNRLRNHRRRLRRDRGLLDRLGPPDMTTASPEGADDWRAVRQALARLRAADRELVLLVAWDELSPAQAAAALGITPGAARTRLHRARARLAGDVDAQKTSADSPAPARQTLHSSNRKAVTNE